MKPTGSAGPVLPPPPRESARRGRRVSKRTEEGDRTAVLSSLRRLGGRATAGDLVTDSGLSFATVRAALKTLLESHHGHLAVTNSGELVYDFDERLMERDHEPTLTRVRSLVGSIARRAFKGWIVVMLVAYFSVMVVLVIAALLASQRGSDSRGSLGGRHHRGSIGFDPMLWYWIWGPRWRIGRPYYGHRWERTLPQDDRVPFYKKVFAFVFGPDQPRPTQEQRDRSKLRLIRARAGVVTHAEMVEHTGSAFAEVEEEMGRLLGTYDGEVAISPDGGLVYAFPAVMASARGAGHARAPNPAWMRLEPSLELTGNSKGANAIVAGMNTFTLIASATAPWFIFPRLGIGGPAAFWSLLVFPLVFSVLFFLGPLTRMVGVALENRRRVRRNARRVLTGFVYDRALRGRPISRNEAYRHVRARLPNATCTVSDVTSLLDEYVAALDGEVTITDDDDIYYRLSRIREQYQDSEAVRRHLKLGNLKLGEIVFSTSDSGDAAGKRDLELFDRALRDGSPSLATRLPSLDRVGIEEPYELLAFDEELRRGRSPRRDTIS